MLILFSHGNLYPSVELPALFRDVVAHRVEFTIPQIDDSITIDAQLVDQITLDTGCPPLGKNQVTVKIQKRWRDNYNDDQNEE